MANKPTYIIIHHSGVSYTQNPNQFAAIDRYHKGKGWGMIGYHWLIEKNGVIKKGRAENVRGAHAKNFNFNSVGICLTGNFNSDQPTSQQKNSLEKLVREVQTRHGVPNDRVLGHREGKGKSTICPGTNMMPVVKELRKPKPKPKPEPKPTTNCEPSYPDVCILVGSADYDCASGSGNGPNYIQGPVRVRWDVSNSDPHRLDRDRDGWGCESQARADRSYLLNFLLTNL